MKDPITHRSTRRSQNIFILQFVAMVLLLAALIIKGCIIIYHLFS